MGKKKNSDALVAKIKEKAQALPKKVYQTSNGNACEYSPTPGNPNGCIVGWAARECGFSLDDLDGDALQALTQGYPDEFYKKAMCYAFSVQTLQDHGYSWGDAVHYADAAASEGLYYDTTSEDAVGVGLPSKNQPYSTLVAVKACELYHNNMY